MDKPKDPKQEQLEKLRAKAREQLEKLRQDPEALARFRVSAYRQAGAYTRARGFDVKLAADVSNEDRQAFDEGYLEAAVAETAFMEGKDAMLRRPGTVRRLLSWVGRILSREG